MKSYGGIIKRVKPKLEKCPICGGGKFNGQDCSHCKNDWFYNVKYKVKLKDNAPNFPKNKRTKREKSEWEIRQELAPDICIVCKKPLKNGRYVYCSDKCKSTAYPHLKNKGI